MTTFSYAARDSATMLRRNLRHLMRYPAMAVSVLGLPVIMLLLFVYVFGGTLGAGLGAPRGLSYIDYLAPGIIVLAVCSGAVSTAVSVNVDMTEGIINRFRTMAIARVSVLTGHVLGSMVKTAFGLVVTIGVALLIGFRPTADPLAWLAVIGLLAAFTFALTWLTVALGLAAKTVESASNTPMFLMLLPFLSSAFVPTASMPPGLRVFAEYQPFTPITETLRGLFFGTPIGNDGIVSLAWCAGIALVSFLWARKLFARDPIR
jgi:ABC-2 type transport system permease protein